MTSLFSNLSDAIVILMTHLLEKGTDIGLVQMIIIDNNHIDIASGFLYLIVYFAMLWISKFPSGIKTRKSVFIPTIKGDKRTFINHITELPPMLLKH